MMDTGSGIDDSDPDWGRVSGPSCVEPDLTVTRVTASLERAVGSPISLSWTVKNAGTAATSESWHDSVYLSATPQSPRTLLMSFAEPARRGLPAGASYSVTRSVSIPDGLAAGRNYLTVVTDSDYGLRESSYGNNAFSVPVDINASPLVGLPSPLDLGSVMVGEVNEPTALTVRSVFSGRVEVGRVSAEPGGGKSGQGGRGGPKFEPVISRDNCTGERLGRGDKCRMELTVKIADRKFAGAFKVRILISSKDASGSRLPDSPITITGEAVPGPLVGSPSPLDLGNVVVEQASASRTLTVRNLLARHVEVGRVSAEEGRGVRTAFQPIITHDQCTGERLPAGGRCQMDVAIKITGRRLGRFTVRILIGSSDASGGRLPDSPITITGVATRP
jgi:hypothetical protein